MKPKLLIAVAITATLITRMASAGAVHSFVITENSPTNFTVTYDGSPLTVFFEGPDSWKFSLPVSFLSNDFGYVQWTEPENSNLVNLVNFGLEDTRDGTVDSDHPSLTNFPSLRMAQ